MKQITPKLKLRRMNKIGVLERNKFQIKVGVIMMNTKIVVQSPIVKKTSSGLLVFKKRGKKSAREILAEDI